MTREGKESPSFARSKGSRYVKKPHVARNLEKQAISSSPQCHVCVPVRQRILLERCAPTSSFFNEFLEVSHSLVGRSLEAYCFARMQLTKTFRILVVGSATRKRSVRFIRFREAVEGNFCDGHPGRLRCYIPIWGKQAMLGRKLLVMDHIRSQLQFKREGFL